jgi:hypothetical protein
MKEINRSRWVYYDHSIAILDVSFNACISLSYQQDSETFELSTGNVEVIYMTGTSFKKPA